MKNKIYSFVVMAIIVLVSIGAFGQTSEAANQPAGYKFELKPFLQISRKFDSVQIVQGESESEKRDRENAAKQAAQASRAVVARSSASGASESVDLESLRALYKQAAAQYGIDWRLIEAVHQVETGKSGSTCKRNLSGATGPMQFLPSTFRHYFDGDICNLRDAVFAGANLLAQSGAASGDIDSALFSYNHSQSYVNMVRQIMNSI